ncbi:MAG: flippase-like domain-containing protein [candidate division Zixibacteria bacterium]|nr:flippase-like domain-containing protein [candidate division Zixibacteria bacterium]
MKIRWKIILGIIISAVFLIYALSQVDFAEVIKAFSEASYGWTIPMMLSVIFAMVIRTWRWKWLLSPIGDFRFGTLFSSIMIGFMANNILPARIGEIVRAVSLSKKHSLSRSSIFATVVAERVFDSFGLLVVFFITLFFVDYPEILKKSGLIVLAMTCLLLIFLYILKVKTETTVRIFCAPIKFVSANLSTKAESILRKFADGLSILTSPASIAVIFLYSVFLWIFTAIAGYMIFFAFDLHPSIWASFIMLFATVLAVSLPSSPGFIGTFQAGCVFAFDLIASLGMFGQDVSKSIALSYSIVLWSCQYFPITIIGLYYFKKEHLKINEISQE